MKLLIEENKDITVFADFVKEISETDLTEDQVLPDEYILPAKEYEDSIDTRKYLSRYLKALSDRLKAYPYVEKSWVKTPKKTVERGLSNYVRIVFNHPKGISEDEIEQHYTYSIRFSDHKHEEAKQDVKILDSVEVVGMKPKNFEKARIKVFNSCVSDVQRAIAKFEKERFGKQITFF